jgi:hypothetical protein
MQYEQGSSVSTEFSVTFSIEKNSEKIFSYPYPHTILAILHTSDLAK